MSKSITREQFITAWDNRCNSKFGLGHEDLPDLIFIDDYWHEGIKAQEAKDALDCMLEEMRNEFADLS
jgi:hypothetical protein